MLPAHAFIIEADHMKTTTDSKWDTGIGIAIILALIVGIPLLMRYAMSSENARAGATAVEMPKADDSPADE
jgi:hypothetical protein